MSGENSAGLGDLQREAEKHRAALRASEAKIEKIEEKARLEQEESDRKQREIAILQKKLAGANSTISWIGRRIAELKGMAESLVDLACDGRTEAAMNLKGVLAEIWEWRREVAVFEEYASGVPAKIEKLRG